MAEQVIPHFRPPDGKPIWAREERPAVHTRTEMAAQHGKPTPPLARLDDVGLVDTRVAHVPELREAGDGSGDGRAAVGTDAPGG
jgi:hypothetical protein